MILLEQAWATFCQLRAALQNFQMTEGRMIIYVVFVSEEILTVHFILTFFHIYAVFMLISTAILKVRVKSPYDFRDLDHLFQ